jgi:predicted transcriptional regulator
LKTSVYNAKILEKAVFADLQKDMTENLILKKGNCYYIRANKIETKIKFGILGFN